MTKSRVRRAPSRVDRSRANVIRAGAVSAFTALTLVTAATPFQASAADDAPQSQWGHGRTQALLPVEKGVTTAPASIPRATDPTQGRTTDVQPFVATDRDAGDTPWHQYANTRLTDSAVARVDISTGNLVLASTDLDIAGVGQRLRMTRTANSFWTIGKGNLGLQLLGMERGIHEWTGSVDVTGESGNTIRFTKNPDGTFTTPKGYKADLTLAAGVYTLTWRSDGKKETFTAADGLTSITDRNGGQIAITHPAGTVLRATDTRSGRWIELRDAVATPGGKDHTLADNAGRTVTHHLGLADPQDPWGEMLLNAVDDVDGKTTHYEYDTDLRPTKVTTPEGRVTRFTYDADNRVTSMAQVTDLTNGQEAVTLYAYSAAPGQAGTNTVTDPRGNATLYAVQADGKVDRVTDAQGHKRDTTYDANNNVATAVDAMGTGNTPGSTSTYGWDASGNLTSAQMPTGATASLTGYQTYAGAQLPASLTDPDGSKTSYSYDTLGNTLGVSDATVGGSGAQLTNTYNPASATCGGFKGQRCTSKDANDNVTAFTYDAKGDLTKTDAPGPLGDTIYTYDNLGRPATVKDGRNVTTTYTYDKHDRVKTVTTPGKNVAYVYDDDGNQTKRTDAVGVLKVEYDDLGREWRRTMPSGDQTTLGYDAAGNTIRYVDPMGPVVYTYDTVNNLTVLKDAAGKTTTFAYNANGERTSTTYPGGVVQAVDLDKSGRPTRVKATKGATVLTELNYTYAYGSSNTDGSKIRTRTDGAGVKNTYTYDTLGRLTNARETNPANTQLAAWLYCHDKAGNLTATSTATTACNSAGTTYTYNAANQTTNTGWTFDANGNETAAGGGLPRAGEAYSAFNQLTAITRGSTTTDAVYAGTTNAERFTFGATEFYYGSEGLAATTVNDTQDTGFVREPSGSLIAMSSGGSHYYYLTDAQGSVIAMTDEQGNKVNTYTYDPYGNARTTTEAVANPYRYTATYLDPTGLYKMGARYYDPTVGRFTQPDPSGQETNPYAYAAGDPVNRTDPTGLKFKFGKALTTVGAAVVGVAAVAGAVATAPACITVAGCVAPVTFGGTALASFGVSYDAFDAM